MVILANVEIDRIMPLLTIYSILFILIGLPFISFDALGHPKGLLPWLIRVIIPGLVVILFWPLVFYISSSYLLGPFNIRDIIMNFILYGSLIAMFYGLFTHNDDIQEKYLARQQESGVSSLSGKELPGIKIRIIKSKVFVDGFTGFLFASLYWVLAISLIIRLFPLSWHHIENKYNGTYAVWSYLIFAVLGSAGGASWRLLHRSSSTATDRPATFSWQDCLKGLMLWSLVCLGIYALSTRVFDRMFASDLLLLGTIILVAVGGLLSGYSQSIVHRVAACQERSGLLFWLVTWLVIWAITSLILIAVGGTVALLVYVAKTPWNFVQTMLLGTTITVIEGTLVSTILRSIFLWANTRLFRNHLLPAQDISPVEGINSNQWRILDAYFFLFSFLKNRLVSLVSWYEIWFVFSVTLILGIFFPWMNIAIILLLGISITVASIGVFRCIFWWKNRQRGTSPDQISSFSSSRNRLKTLLSWPPMWIGIWIIAVTIICEAASITKPIDLRSLGTSKFLIVPFGLDDLWMSRDDLFFRSPLQISLLIGTIITILTGSLVIGIMSLLLWLVDRLHSVLLNMHSFVSMSIRHSTLLSSIIWKHTEGSGGRPPFFSLRDSCIGLVFWPAMWFASAFIVQLVFDLWQDIFAVYSHSLSQVYPLDISFLLNIFNPLGLLQLKILDGWSILIAVAIAGVLIGGLSRFICWKALEFKQLGTLGAIITIIGLGLQLVEPTRHFLSPSPHHHGHHGPVLAIAWSPDGKQIASASSDSSDATVQIWDSSTGNPDDNPPGNENPVKAVAWSPDRRNKYVAFASSTELDIWDAANKYYINSTKYHITPNVSMTWSRHGQYLAYPGDTDSSGGNVLVWNVDNNRYAKLTPKKKHAELVKKVAWSPDGKFIAAAGDHGTVWVWDKVTEKDIPTYSNDTNYNHTKENVYRYQSHIGGVNALAWSPDSKRIASAGQDKTVRVWDVTTQSTTVVYQGHKAPVNDVTWSPEGKHIVSASDDKTAQVWNEFNGEKVTYHNHRAPVESVAWSPASGSSHIATASADDTVQIWDTISGDHILTYGDSGSQ